MGNAKKAKRKEHKSKQKFCCWTTVPIGWNTYQKRAVGWIQKKKKLSSYLWWHLAPASVAETLVRLGTTHAHTARPETTKSLDPQSSCPSLASIFSFLPYPSLLSFSHTLFLFFPYSFLERSGFYITLRTPNARVCALRTETTRNGSASFKQSGSGFIPSMPYYTVLDGVAALTKRLCVARLVTSSF